jgi:hypothetical protein
MHPARSRFLRRWFIASLLLTISLLIIVRFKFFSDLSLSADWETTLATVLDNLLASAATALIVGLAYIFLFPNVESEALESVQGRDISSLISSAANNARQWDVRSRTASYFTRVTLPMLRDTAFRSGGDVDIRIQTLNPDNDAALASYARFRSNHAGAASVWTVERVRGEIFATILAAALIHNEAPRLRIKVGLSDSFWVMSVDACENVVIVTGQNRGDPALVIKADSPHFQEWREDFDASFSVCRIVTPKILNLTVKDLDHPTPQTADAVKQLLLSTGTKLLTDAHVASAMDYQKRKHNYE